MAADLNTKGEDAPSPTTHVERVGRRRTGTIQKIVAAVAIGTGAAVYPGVADSGSLGDKILRALKQDAHPEQKQPDKKDAPAQQQQSDKRDAHPEQKQPDKKVATKPLSGQAAKNAERARKAQEENDRLSEINHQKYLEEQRAAAAAAAKSKAR